MARIRRCVQKRDVGRRLSYALNSMNPALAYKLTIRGIGVTQPYSSPTANLRSFRDRLTQAAHSNRYHSGQ